MTTLLLFVMLATAQRTSAQSFADRCDLQGVYDEFSQATLSSHTPADIDLFHDVFDAPNIVIIDVHGERHDWNAIRDARVKALSEPPTELRQIIETLTITADGAVATVHVITMRRITDAKGAYGLPGVTHTIANVTPMKDTWIKTPVAWRLQTREQLGATDVLIDKEPYELWHPKCPSH